MTEREATQFFFGALGPGAEDHYDLAVDGNGEPLGDVGKFFASLAKTLNTYGFEMAEQLRQEVVPSTCTQKIPDWEDAFGINYSKTALFGTTEQRRNQIVGYFRALCSGFDFPGLRLCAQTFLQYADPSQIEIIEASRGDLQLAHTMTDSTTITVSAGTSHTWTFDKNDGPVVSPAGAFIEPFLTGAEVAELSFKLEGPDGTLQSWPAGWLGSGAINQKGIFKSKLFAGKAIKGIWRFTITAGADDVEVDFVDFFVEGLGRNPDGSDGLGAAVFNWVFVADRALEGAAADEEGLLRLIPYIKPAHTVGGLVIKNAVMGGGKLAIPDLATTLPDASIPA